MSTLRVLIAAPASGKTSLCRENAARFGTVYSLDRARAQLGLHAHDHTVSAAAVAAVHAEIDETLADGVDVTLDATSTVAEHRARWLGLARRHGARPIALVLRADLPTILHRNALRARPVPTDVVERMWHEVQQLTVPALCAEGFADVSELDGYGRPLR
ncbi:AAA family ATPase [Amycolatopsis roodepoortensis]|uniref:Kinase n=1 Tax=Amycolatopsis roodepoortensis TaxID=700274 RepID=A0ABR9LII2_9PSEU|nr:AAA family ATPase [Amycolatopsis roodepoortensis]MBE1580463.1 putative kinase [Amycolatopsis roodepoortensis]